MPDQTVGEELVEALNSAMEERHRIREQLQKEIQSAVSSEQINELSQKIAEEQEIVMELLESLNTQWKELLADVNLELTTKNIGLSTLVFERLTEIFGRFQ